jgi:glycosyltransferase involved in cell wall biosynthesis
MKNIFYVYRTERGGPLKGVFEKKEPDHVLYGLTHLRNRGYVVKFSDVAFSNFNILKWLFLPLQRLFINGIGTGFKFDQALLLIPRLNSSDVIITTTDSAGLPILFLKKIGIVRKKIIYISIGLVNELMVAKRSWLKQFTIDLLKNADVIICYSRSEKEILNKLVPEKQDNTYFIPFGIDTYFFKNNSKQTNYLLSIGRDKSRDYNLLASIANHFTNNKFVLVTSPSSVLKIKFPANVQVLFDLPYLSIKKLLSDSKVVILPLKEINRASGQIAFLEALASGKQVVVGNVKGISQVYSDLVMNKNVHLYKEGDLKDAVRKIKKALSSKPVAVNLNNYSSKLYAKKLMFIIEQI